MALSLLNKTLESHFNIRFVQPLMLGLYNMRKPKITYLIKNVFFNLKLNKSTANFKINTYIGTNSSLKK